MQSRILLAGSGDVQKNMMRKGESSRKVETLDSLNVSSGSLLDCYPNPFNPTTTIRFDVPGSPNGQAGFVTLKVYDMLGRVVATLVEGNVNAGRHTVQFNGQNLASGIYICRLTAPGIERVRKMILMK